MNPGYLSYIALTLSLILVGFGFRAHAIGRSSAWSAASFSAAWIVAAAVDWNVGAASGTLVYAPLLALIAAGFAAEPLGLKESASALTFGLLLGALYSLVELVESVDPLIIAVHPSVDPALLTTALVVCFTHRPALQFALVSIAAIVNDAYMAMLYAEWQTPYFGGRAFQDAWWLCAFSVRLATVAAGAAAAALRRGGSRWRKAPKAKR
ncbi:YphA family membrane protein [Paenibacillus sp.]|uniref:YphA family membrane protein n=1 Tax=Paenibacillus sp. TaxID=58172 RepID=UPI002D34F279|nr:hypothetical protein [Paenibacillus sp.]HZG85224.1 hypothetical protein [Paenibacillus sp.]